MNDTIPAQGLESELQGYEAKILRLQTRITHLSNAATAALGWIDYIYPPDIFIGLAEDADEGVIEIAMIRENLRQALNNETQNVSR